MVVRVYNNNRDQGQGSGGQGSGGTGENQRSALDQLKNTFVSLSVEQQVIKAELIWLLKMVQSDFSFRSADNMVEMLRLLDKEDKIFPRLTLGRQKCSYYITHALYPFYLEALIQRILEAPAYTLGVDGGSFKVRGLKKMIDIVIRWLYLFQYSLIAYPGTTTSQGGRLLMSSWTHMRLVMSQPTSK